MEPRQRLKWWRPETMDGIDAARAVLFSLGLSWW